MLKPYYESPEGQIFHGSALDILRQMPSESVQMCVTSPPYWGLRDYGLPPMVWDAQEECEHEWGDEAIIACGNAPSDKSTLTTNSGQGPLPGNKYQADKKTDASQGQFCQKCNAWRGCLGLEPTPELYIKHMVQIFRELHRVLRNDGTLWLNMGDSYAGGGRAGYSGNAYGGLEANRKKQRIASMAPRPEKLKE